MDLSLRYLKTYILADAPYGLMAVSFNLLSTHENEKEKKITHFIFRPAVALGRLSRGCGFRLSAKD